MARERRYGDSTSRSPLPDERTRDRELEGNRPLHSRGGAPRSASFLPEVLGGNDSRLDRYGNRQIPQLSHFSESLPPRDSPSLKFQWNRLLVENPPYTSLGGRSGGRSGGSFGADPSIRSTERDFRPRSLCSDFGAIPQSASMEIERSRAFPGDLNRCLSKKEDNSLLYRSNVPFYMSPNSPAKFYDIEPAAPSKNVYHGSCRDDLSLHLDGIRERASGLVGQRTTHDGDNRTRVFKYHEQSDTELRDLAFQRAAQFSPMQGIDGPLVCSGIQKTDNRNIGPLSNDTLYENKASILKDYRQENTYKCSILDPIVDRIDASLDDMRDYEQFDQFHFLKKQYHDRSIASSSIEPDEAIMCASSTHLEYGTYVHEDHNVGEDYGFEQDSLRAIDARFDEDNFYGTENRPEMVRDYTYINAPSESIHTTKGTVLKNSLSHNLKGESSLDWDAYENFPVISKGGEQGTADAYLESGFSSPYQLVSRPKQEKSRDRDMKTRLGPLGPATRSRKYINSTHIDVKKRLGPLGPAPHSRKFIKSANRDVKKRLGPPGMELKVSKPWVGKKIHSYPKKFTPDSHGIHVKVGNSSEVEMKCAKPEIAEDSEEFKNLVHNYFLKFIKRLNETPAQRRIYMEQGEDKTLKCGICGSNSRDYTNTLSLAIHSSASHKAGSRAEHLGFHKALCVLMGWNSSATFKKSWVQQILPDAQALALKDDLIIWPPVVIIHNRSTASTNPDDRKIVSPEELGHILKEMGFGGGKTKIFRGKPANHSILVISFHGTFSGLQEAEKLHKLYAEKKHGRFEFEQSVAGNNNISSKGGQKLPTTEMESPLYGYLGIAWDLDKLDFEIKERSKIRSKKEIQTIADFHCTGE